MTSCVTLRVPLFDTDGAHLCHVGVPLQDFLDAVTRSAVNIINVVAHYNATLVPANAGLNAIPVLRTCLYSSSGYKRTSVTRDAVALAVYAGFDTQLLVTGASSGIQMVEFENGAGEFSAVP